MPLNPFNTPYTPPSEPVGPDEGGAPEDFPKTPEVDPAVQNDQPGSGALVADNGVNPDGVANTITGEDAGSLDGGSDAGGVDPGAGGEDAGTGDGGGVDSGGGAGG